MLVLFFCKKYTTWTLIIFFCRSMNKWMINHNLILYFIISHQYICVRVCFKWECWENFDVRWCILFAFLQLLLAYLRRWFIYFLNIIITQSFYHTIIFSSVQCLSDVIYLMYWWWWAKRASFTFMYIFVFIVKCA